MAGNEAAIGGGDPDRLGFSDEIADGQHEAVIADDDAGALAFRAQRGGGEGILRRGGAQADDGTERGFKVKWVVAGVGLQLGRNCPILWHGHPPPGRTHRPRLVPHMRRALIGR